MYVRTADIDLKEPDLLLFVQLFTGVCVFVHRKAADIGNDRLTEAFCQFGQFLGNYFFNAGILQPNGVYHACRTFRDTRRRVAETGFFCRSLERKGAEDVDVIQFRKFIPIAECTAGGDDGIFQRQAAEGYACFYHRISSFSSTGPSLQMRLLPYFVWQEQPMHAPKPQPMRSSKLNCPLVFVQAERAFSIGSGPQA